MIEFLMNAFVTVLILSVTMVTAAIPFVLYQMIYWAWKGDR